LSNFPNECERLFFQVDTLRIVDIHSFHQGKRFYNKTQIKALSLWSALFSGNYLSNLSKKTQQILVAFIQHYNVNNNIESQGEIVNKRVSLFQQQLFYNLIQKLDQTIVIDSQYEKLNQALKDELFCLDSGKVYGQSEFYKKQLKNPIILQEYVWQLDANQIEALQTGEKGEWIYSDSFYFDVSNEEMVEFELGIRNNLSDQYMGFSVEIIDTPMKMDEVFSVYVDKINYPVDACRFYNKSSGEDENIFFFEEEKLKEMKDGMTIRTAIRFEKA